MDLKNIKKISQILLLAVIVIIPFLKLSSLYFPFISVKAYLFRFFVIFALFFWVLLIVKAKSEKIKEQSYLPDFKNILVVALILFFLAQVFVSFFSVDRSLSFFSSLDRQEGVLQFGFWILYFLMLVSLFKKDNDYKNVFISFVIVALILSFYSFLYSFFSSNSSQPKFSGYSSFSSNSFSSNSFSSNSSQPKFSGRFGNPAYFGGYLIFAIGFSLILYQRKYFYFSFIHHSLPLIAFFLAITLVLTTIRGSLAGLLSGVFLFCLLAILFLRKENKKLAKWSFFGLLSIFILLTIIFSQKETAFVKSSPVLSRLTAITDFWEVASIRERLLNWNIALKGFKERPFFGWGLENYGVVANKFYDLRINKNEPWFDRPHNQLLDILVSGGIVLFLFYLFWIFSVFYLTFKAAKKDKTLSFISASLFLAYLVQSLFLFDTLPIYLGLFPFLAYLVFLNKEDSLDNLSLKKAKHPFSFYSYFFIIISVVFFVFLLYHTVFIPWKANNLAKHFHYFYRIELEPQKEWLNKKPEEGLYKKSKPYLEKAFSFYSPYTYWEIRKITARAFLEFLDLKKDNENIEEAKELYDFLLPEFEKYIENKPFDPQFYYILAQIYITGFEKLGKNDLDKAEKMLKKSFYYSDLRIEYFNNYIKILLLQKKNEDAEKAVFEYLKKVPLQWGKEFPFILLGNFYFEEKKYNQSLEQYDKAREVGFRIEKDEDVYSRYLFSSQEIKDYQRIVEMAQKFLEEKGPSAETYFNIAVGYWYLNEKDKSKEFFLKAVELDNQYKDYEHFFLNRN